MSRRIAPTVLVLILLGAGCGSGGEPDDAVLVDSSELAPVAADEDAATTTTAAPATTAAPETTTTAANLDAASCVVGEWALDSETFVQSIATLIAEGTDAEASMSFTGGTYHMAVEGDGSWTATREDWTLEIEVADLGITRVTVNGVDEGTYRVTSGADGATMSVDATDSSTKIDIALIVNGEEIALPAGSQQVDVDPLAGSGALTCDDDVMSIAVESEGETVRSVFERTN